MHITNQLFHMFVWPLILVIGLVVGCGSQPVPSPRLETVAPVTVASVPSNAPTSSPIGSNALPPVPDPRPLVKLSLSASESEIRRSRGAEGWVVFTVQLTNQGTKSETLPSEHRLGVELRDNLRFHHRRGTEFRLVRLTKEGIPAPGYRVPVLLPAGKSYRFQLEQISAWYAEHADYRFVRVEPTEIARVFDGKTQSLPLGYGAGAANPELMSLPKGYYDVDTSYEMDPSDGADSEKSDRVYSNKVRLRIW